MEKFDAHPASSLAVLLIASESIVPDIALPCQPPIVKPVQKFLVSLELIFSFNHLEDQLFGNVSQVGKIGFENGFCPSMRDAASHSIQVLYPLL